MIRRDHLLELQVRLNYGDVEGAKRMVEQMLVTVRPEQSALSDPPCCSASNPHPVAPLGLHWVRSGGGRDSEGSEG